MGRALLVWRLALRDLRRRRTEALLLVLAIMAATTTLALGLVLHGMTDDPYERTREATAGPDVVASVSPTPDDVGAGVSPTPDDDEAGADLDILDALADASGVVAHSGPYPVTGALLEADGHRATALAEGRGAASATVDQPLLTEGAWVEDGGVVLEAAFADALEVGAGDEVTLGGRSFRVAGVAVTAAVGSGVAPPYVSDLPIAWMSGGTLGLVWVSQADLRALAPDASALSYVMHLQLADPADAPAFVAEHAAYSVYGEAIGDGPAGPAGPRMQARQDIREEAANLVRNEQRALVTASWLLGLLAAASVTVLVGGRMADQTRRVGLLKAVGGTPGLVAAVLLAEHVAIALVAAAAGLALGWLVAPLLTDPSAAMIGYPATPSLALSTVGVVTAAALAVAGVATIVPAVRAARTSTVRALAGSARPPRRTAWLVALSARLPVALLVGLRVLARRPRRVVLGSLSIAVTVTGIVAVLCANAQLTAEHHVSAAGYEEIRTDRLGSVLLMITVMLVALAAVNAVFITWTTVLDAQHASALVRALGVTPSEVSTGLAAAQALPALAGALLGIPAGLALFVAINAESAPTPPLWQLVAVVPATVLVVALLATIPARLGTRRPAAEILQAELA